MGQDGLLLVMGAPGACRFGRPGGLSFLCPPAGRPAAPTTRDAAWLRGSRCDGQFQRSGPKLPLSAPGVAATGSRVLSAGIILGVIPRAVDSLAGRRQAIEASPPRIGHFC